MLASAIPLRPKSATEERIDNEDECKQSKPGDCFVKVACRTGTAPNEGMDLLLPLVLLEGGAARETR